MTCKLNLNTNFLSSYVLSENHSIVTGVTAGDGTACNVMAQRVLIKEYIREFHYKNNRQDVMLFVSHLQ